MTQPDNSPRGGLREAAAEATGFGAGEIRMTRDLMLRPGRVALAVEAGGSDYPRPIRYYLTLTGLYLALITILGGFENSVMVMADMLPGVTRDAVDLSGKSLDSF